MTPAGTDVPISGSAGTCWDWVLLLPPGWVRMPTAAAAGRRAVAAMLDRRLRHLPRDQIAGGRRRLEQELRQQLAAARASGASEVYAQVDLVHGMPVSAGLTVGRLQVGGDDESLMKGLTALLGAAGDVVACEPATVGGVPALRRRRRFLRAVADGTPALPQTAVDWVVPLPDSDDVLVLAFATSTEQIADALVALFDAIAMSLELTPRA